VSDSLPVVLVPGLLCSPRLFAEQIPALWGFGPVTVADHRRDPSLAEIASRLLATAPPTFALVGLSMGGYTAFEVMRQAPSRVERLALLDTSARPETAEQTRGRLVEIGMAEGGRFGEVAALRQKVLVHPDRVSDPVLLAITQAMAEETGAPAFVRQQRAIMGRPDSRPGLSEIACPTLVLVGDADASTPPEHAREIADRIPGARLVEVERCGHLSPLERPADVTRALVDFLAPQNPVR
jgi:pimeloyl-ACP methyl ester carboxylesterase